MSRAEMELERAALEDRVWELRRLVAPPERVIEAHLQRIVDLSRWLAREGRASAEGSGVSASSRSGGLFVEGVEK